MSSLNTNLDDVYYTTDFRQIYNDVWRYIFFYCKTVL